MKEKLLQSTRAFHVWLFQPRHRAWVRVQKTEARRAFTEHPHAAGESYWQHLGFTLWMTLRFIYVSIVMLLHGIFPFLFERGASDQIESIYRILKARIPKSRRDAIDIDYNV